MQAYYLALCLGEGTYHYLLRYVHIWTTWLGDSLLVGVVTLSVYLASRVSTLPLYQECSISCGHT